MPPKVGLMGTLSVIALGVALSGGSAQASVASDEQLCRLIESMPDAVSFQANPQVMDALKNSRNACHGVALGKWAKLSSSSGGNKDLGPPTSTGSIGYGFQ